MLTIIRLTFTKTQWSFYVSLANTLVVKNGLQAWDRGEATDTHSQRADPSIEQSQSDGDSFRYNINDNINNNINDRKAVQMGTRHLQRQ